MNEAEKPNNLVIFIVFGALLAVIIFFLVMAFNKPFKESLQANFWQKTECKIIHSEMTEQEYIHNRASRLATRNINVRGSKAYKCTSDLKYSYEFNGKKYTGTNYDFTNHIGTEFCMIAKKIKDELPAGSVHKCLVNPILPEEVTIKAQSIPNLVMAFFVLILIVVIFGTAVIKR